MTDKQKTGIELIAEERRRLIACKFDEKYFAAGNGVGGDLAVGAVIWALPSRYCGEALTGGKGLNGEWPFEWVLRWEKKICLDAAGRIRELQRAGALIAAEIDRLQRASDGNPF